MLQNGFFGSYDVNDAYVADYDQWRIDWRPGDPGAGGTPSLPATGVWHKVRPGDTLAALAVAYGHHGAGHRGTEPHPDHRRQRNRCR